jgi:hypothetical protein
MPHADAGARDLEADASKGLWPRRNSGVERHVIRYGDGLGRPVAHRPGGRRKTEIQ